MSFTTKEVVAVRVYLRSKKSRKLEARRRKTNTSQLK
jgi:hypothetical protein